MGMHDIRKADRRERAAMFLGPARRSPPAVRVEPRMYNGQPAFLTDRRPRLGFATRV